MQAYRAGVAGGLEGVISVTGFLGGVMSRTGLAGLCDAAGAAGAGGGACLAALSCAVEIVLGRKGTRCG